MRLLPDYFLKVHDTTSTPHSCIRVPFVAGWNAPPDAVGYRGYAPVVYACPVRGRLERATGRGRIPRLRPCIWLQNATKKTILSVGGRYDHFTCTQCS